MNSVPPLLAVASALFVGGCVALVFPWQDDGRNDDCCWDTWWRDTWRRDTGRRDTGAPDADHAIVSITIRCDTGDPVVWVYDVVTRDRVDGVRVDVVETGLSDWSALPVETVALAGSTTTWTGTVTTSPWDCSYALGSGGAGPPLAWRVTTIDDAADDACGILGGRSEDYWNGEQGSDCACFDRDDDCAN